MAFDDSNGALAFDRNYTDGAAGGQVVLLVDQEQLALRMPVFATSIQVRIVEYNGVLFKHHLPPGTAELDIVASEQTVRVNRAFLDRFGTVKNPHPSNVILRFATPCEKITSLNLDDLFSPAVTYYLSTTAQEALKRGLLRYKNDWSHANGTYLKHYRNIRAV